MPYKSSKIIIKGTKHDRRLKLTDKQRIEIKDKLANGSSQRSLAREYQVDRKTIYNIKYPKKYAQSLQDRVDNQVHLKYYDKDEWREVMKEHRRYKQNLYKKGKIKWQ